MMKPCAPARGQTAAVYFDSKSAQTRKKGFSGWIQREPEILSDADVAMATLHMKQYIKRLAA